MKKNKQILKTIISSTFLFLFVLSFFQFILPAKTEAITDTSNKLNWENPNKKGDNPYKLNTDAVLNPKTMMQVIGCTGIVDRVSEATMGFLNKKVTQAERAIEKVIKDAAKAKACKIAKATIESAIAAVPGGQPLPETPAMQEAIKVVAECDATIKTSNPTQDILIKEQTDEIKTNAKMKECFDGLAYTLAKNQLTSMTRQTINWINSGFNGNPLYVQNITSLTNSIGKNVLENGIMVLADGAFPYSDTFANTAIRNYRTGGLGSGSFNLFADLSSDLSAFVTDTKSYFNTPDTTSLNETRRKREIEASRAFSNDFSVGGWDGWNALTQRDQNNPLGFTMMAAQKIADEIDYQTNVTNDELKENNGFLSQKECTLWQSYDNSGKNIYIEEDIGGGEKGSVPKTSKNKENKNDKCIKWKTTTPGSIIRDKISSYMGSAERQLEMADTINEGLNGLFTKLIENFRSEGLFGLSQNSDSTFDPMGNAGFGGYGSNELGINTNLLMGYENSYYENNSGYDADFDLTRDLGNTYIRKDIRSLGKWDAGNNKIWNPSTDKWDGGELNVDLGIYNEISESYEPGYYYYTVEYPGNTKLFNNGYNGWAVGDRAFWNGEKWQNWKNGQASPIDTRGVIQIQSDYIVAAKEILKVLPGIMPKIGELDYCIPGPNPSYETNAKNAGNLFADYANTLSSTYTPGAFFKRNSTTWSIAKPGTDAYDDYKNIFYNYANNASFFENRITNLRTWKTLQGYAKTLDANVEEEAHGNLINEALVTINNSIKKFFIDYKKEVFDKYSIMLPEYLEKENSFTPIENTAYLPMLSDGYNITKNMVTYAENIKNTTEDYKNSIIEAQSNIGKLNIIKSEVSKIIKTAQERRKAVMLEKYKPLTEAQYKEKYADCLLEEDILYYDDKDIMKDTDVTKERCTNGFDDDLDGLVDSKDPDCKETN